LIKISKFFFGIVTFLLAGMVLLTRNIELLPFSNLGLGIFTFIVGIEEYQKGRKGNGYWVIGGSIFILFVSIFTFTFLYN
jgi:hypothetical protein